MSAFLFKGAFLLTNQFLEYSHFFLIEIVFMFLIGPLLYFYFNLLINDLSIKRSKVFLHLSPPILFGTLLSLDTIRIWLTDSSFSDLQEDYIGRYEYVYRFAAVFPAVYITVLARKYYLIFHNSFLKDKWPLHIQIIFILSIVSSLMSLLMDLRFLLGLEDHFEALYKILLFTLTLIVIYTFFISQKYPNTFNLISNTIKQIQYEKSTLVNINISAVDKKINELIEIEKVYLNPKLNLRNFAKKLGITPHQCSEFLNVRLNVNFNTFVNRFRIEESQRLLSEKKELGILEIAFASGFNSLSSFNACFKKEVGISPRSFRQKKAMKRNGI
ncbi:AraC family transcriptional regulator [Leptospira tipperaryensis]|nr:helix-turn-helix domain-containing protein [Leptospira tipperaryensis]